MRRDDDHGARERDRLGPPPTSAATESSLDQNEPSTRRRWATAGARKAGLILIADDTFDTRELYGFYLTQCGFAVQTVTDGEEAVEAALESRPDVIVLDLSMPRVDGIAATKHLKSQPDTRHIPVILVTGFPHRAAQRGALDAGADVFLGKPCLPEDLARHVQRLIDRSRRPAA
jgi:two-component system cell cycle response regulator DivK